MTFQGRVRLPCEAHPRRINLMDTRFCPKLGCNSDRLIELDVSSPR
ncbi:unnamed protein product [Gongylonema pulchrum]|uniref:Uncharacterized protein n=1 Tax=Gongylonema pulchrum TaxID=637853 RepID=A0A183DCS9_9BILA|nr:unnamed protein product [Gongylonema pulchrum]